MGRRDDEALQAAHAALTRALIGLADDGGRPACAADPDRWISDDPADVSHSRNECRGCPVFEQCDAAGQHESWGTWAGQWRGPAGKKARKTA